MVRLYFIVLIMVFSQVVQAEHSTRLITVNGQATVANTPDMLEFSVFVEERGESASKLARQVNNKSEQIVDLLTDNGVREKDIQSMQLNLYPWFERDRNAQKQRGFVLNRHIKIVLRDFSNYASLLDNLIKIGAQRIDNFQYRIEDSETAYLKALDNAIDNAQLRARKTAMALGVKVGKVVMVTEQSGYSPRPEQGLVRSQFKDSGGFMPGQMNISANVLVKFEIME